MCVHGRGSDGRTAALICCCLSTRSRNVSRGNTWKIGEEAAAVSALPLALNQAYVHAQTRTSHMCEGSLGSQSAALNKAFLFLPLIAGWICHCGVEFLISALTERGKAGACGGAKWMHLLTNEIKPLHLHFPFFHQLEQCYLTLALSTLSYFPLSRKMAHFSYSKIVRRSSGVFYL